MKAVMVLVRYYPLGLMNPAGAREEELKILPTRQRPDGRELPMAVGAEVTRAVARCMKAAGDEPVAR